MGSVPHKCVCLHYGLAKKTLSWAGQQKAEGLLRDNTSWAELGSQDGEPGYPDSRRDLQNGAL